MLTDEEKDQLELLMLRKLVLYLLARDYAVHRQPLAPVWEQWLGPVLEKVASAHTAPEAQEAQQFLQEETLAFLRQAQKLAVNTWREG